LRAIEAQHGLLIERSQKIWSFSHLTFQEYLVANWFCNQENWSNLIKYIAEKRWTEVFILSTELAKNVDSLLFSIKNFIDKTLLLNGKYQSFLHWLNEASILVESRYKVAAIRAFHFDLLRAYALAPVRDRDLDANFEFSPTIDYELGCDLKSYIYFDLDSDIEINGLLKREMQSYTSNYLRDYVEIPQKLWVDDRRINFELLRSMMIRFVEINNKLYEICCPFDRHIDRGLMLDYYNANVLLIHLAENCAANEKTATEIKETILLPIAQIKSRNPKV
jgi:hypothetical protein